MLYSVLLILVVDKIGVIFWIWMGELHPNGYFKLNNSTFYKVERGLSDLMHKFEA